MTFHEVMVLIGSRREPGNCCIKRTDWPDGVFLNLVPVGTGQFWLMIDDMGTQYSFTLEDRMASWDVLCKEGKEFPVKIKISYQSFQGQ